MTAPRTLYPRNGDLHLAYQVIGDGPRDVVLSLDWARVEFDDKGIHSLKGVGDP